MDEMRELVTAEQAEAAIRLVAIALPVIGVVAGAVVGVIKRRLARGLVVGLLCGAVGPAIGGLWLMYNGVIGVYGLDSVKGLLINLALFVGIGLLIGLGVGLGWRRFGHGAGGGSPHPSE